MVMTATQELRLLKARNAALEERIKALEAKLAPTVPKPPAPPPAWAEQSTNVGMAYSGEPSVPQRVTSGIANVTVDPVTGHRKMPDGLVRDDLGQVVPHEIGRTIKQKSVGIERTAQHQQAVEILERDLGR
jgi:hypothetical protein